MAKVPPGGSSTINGVLYQMLWTLLRTTRLHANRCTVDDATGQVVRATLLLEPIGGGGDLQETTDTVRVVQQLKARTRGGSWSLQEVVKGVLPDLYLAADLAIPDSRFEFVTEGRVVGWNDVLTFFGSLKQRAIADSDVLATLDNAKPLEIGIKKRSSSKNPKKEPFWPESKYTERSLFERIVAEIRKRAVIREMEAIEETRRKLWHLLGRFSVLPGQTASSLEKQIDKHLIEIADYAEEVPEKRDALLMALARMATRGNAEINDAAEFLARHGFGSTPFSRWEELRTRGRSYLRGELERLGYRSREDVRGNRAAGIVSTWTAERPMLAITGESGQGKSWLLYSICEVLDDDPGLVVLVESTGDGRDDLAEASRVIWNVVKNHDRPLSIDRIASRLRESIPDPSQRWLTLLIDGVQGIEQARFLAKQPWSAWGVRLAITCETVVASAFESAAQGRCLAPVPVGDFSLEELQAYLTQSHGDDWPLIPGDVRDTLKRPLLARLYRDVAEGAPWRHINEYMLYQSFWDRLDEELADRPLQKVALKNLARSLLDDAPYPWTEDQVAQAGIVDDALTSLVKAGWLRRAPNRRYEVPHDRLLNWLVAVALVDGVCSGSIEIPQFLSRVGESYSSDRLHGGRRLGYAPMDVIWLLAGLAEDASELLDASLETLERSPWPLRDSFYRQLIPTLGPAIVPSLFRRLEFCAASDDSTLPGQIVTAIKAIGDPDAASRAAGLLDHDSPFVVRAAMRILAHLPSPSALDQLWAIHESMRAEPTAFLRPKEPNFLYDESFAALRTCVRLDPGWIERAIRRAESGRVPAQIHDLAYLLANTEGAVEVWERCKPSLMRMVDPHHDRSITANIYKHRDRGEIGWLIDRVSREENLNGAVALLGLIKLDPDAAVENLPRLPIDDLATTKAWCLDVLRARRPTQTHATLLGMLERAEDPWDIALAFQGDEDGLDVGMLDVLLDDLEGRLADVLAGTAAPEKRGLFRPLLLLAKIGRLELLDCLGRRRGTRLELKLTEWILREEPRPDIHDRPERRKALEVLYKIGGSGFTKVVNSYLEAPSRYGWLDGLQLAFKRPDQETIRLLAEAALRDELWGDHILEQGLAMESLVYLGHWREAIVGVLRWGHPIRLKMLDACYGAAPANDEAIAPAIELLAADADTPREAILAVGLSGRVDQAETIRSILKKVPSDSETADSCVVALVLLRDSSVEGIDLLIDQLRVPNHRRWAKIALLRAGSDAGLDALLDHLRTEFELGLAIDLLAFPRTRSEAWRLIEQRVLASSGYRLQEMLGAIVDLDRELVESLFADPRVRDSLRRRSFADEGPIWTVGSKATAIRGLALFDPDAAFLAALSALRNPAAHDRDLYPRLLVELDPDRAAEELLAIATGERLTAVLSAIARSLRGADVSDRLTSMMTSDEAALRRAGCRLAGWAGVSDFVESKLRSMLEDPEEDVAKAAHEALRMRRDAREAELLSDALETEHEPARRWILLDALLDLGDPGSNNHPLPDWVTRALRGRLFLERDYIKEKLDKRRKSIKKEAERRDKKEETA